MRLIFWFKGVLARRTAGDMAVMNWDDITKKERSKVVTKALKKGNVATLCDLTEHNLLLYGRGGAGTSPHTLRSYRAGVKQYLAYALPKGWQRLTEYDTDLTIGYIRHLERQGTKPGTINNRRSAARALYRALRWAGVLHADPFADTPRAADREERWAKREAYSREDVQALLAAADPDEQRFLLLGAHGALRMSELLGLDWSMIELERRTMTVTGKGRKTAVVHLSQALWLALSDVPPEARHGPVLPWRNAKTIRLLLRGLCAQANVKYEKRQVHGLRHAAATMLLADVGDLYVVARHLRHSSVSTTETYAKQSPQRLTEALRNWGSSAGGDLN